MRVLISDKTDEEPRAVPFTLLEAFFPDLAVHVPYVVLKLTDGRAVSLMLMSVGEPRMCDGDQHAHHYDIGHLTEAAVPTPVLKAAHEFAGVPFGFSWQPSKERTAIELSP